MGVRVERVAHVMPGWPISAAGREGWGADDPGAGATTAASFGALGNAGEPIDARLRSSHALHAAGRTSDRHPRL